MTRTDTVLTGQSGDEQEHRVDLDDDNHLTIWAANQQIVEMFNLSYPTAGGEVTA